MARKAERGEDRSEFKRFATSFTSGMQLLAVGFQALAESCSEAARKVRELELFTDNK
jgi:hypothetical protein